jgi:hypothetical protein
LEGDSFMGTKILTIIVLLISVFASLFVYTVYQDLANEKEFTFEEEDVSIEDILDELDETFLTEDDEVTIGEMI